MSIIRKLLLLITFFIISITFIFNRYYIINQADQTKLIQPLKEVIITDQATSEFLDTLEVKVPALEIKPEELQKKSLFK